MTAKLPNYLEAILTGDEVRIATWFAPFIEKSGYRWSIQPLNSTESLLTVEKHCTEVQQKQKKSKSATV